MLNPLAELEPVHVGGVTVSSATLHNEDDIRRKDIRVGDLVIVQRAGDVIPQVVGPAGEHEPGTKPWRMPKRCPLCKAEIVRPEGEVMHRCPNRACPSRGLETLYHWVGPRAGHRERRRQHDQEALGRGGRPLAARSLPADGRAARGARGLRRDLGDARGASRSSARRSSRSRASSSASTSRRSAG